MSGTVITLGKKELAAFYFPYFVMCVIFVPSGHMTFIQRRHNVDATS